MLILPSLKSHDPSREASARRYGSLFLAYCPIYTSMPLNNQHIKLKEPRDQPRLFQLGRRREITLRRQLYHVRVRAKYAGRLPYVTQTIAQRFSLLKK
jgi:hypothetical protein